MKKTMILAVFLAVKSQKFLFFRDPDIFFKMGGGHEIFSYIVIYHDIA